MIAPAPTNFWSEVVERVARYIFERETNLERVTSSRPHGPQIAQLSPLQGPIDTRAQEAIAQKARAGPTDPAA